MRASLAIIDARGVDGRDILIPLLGNANAMVRCEAAKAIHPTRRDLAIPVLQDISLTCLTEAGNTASMFLIFAGEPNRDSDRMAQFHPHRYDDEAYRATASVPAPAPERCLADGGPAQPRPARSPRASRHASAAATAINVATSPMMPGQRPRDQKTPPSVPKTLDPA